jgi:asparagine synthase (glutamine-hydrolysing)
MSSTSMYAQYRVFSLAREHGIKVMLDGQGADEILGGYRYYVGARVTSLVRQGQWLEAAVLLARAACLPGPGGGLWLLPYTATFLLPDALKGPAMRLMGEAMMPAWMNADWFAERGVRPAIPRWSRRPEALREQLHQTLLRTSLPKLLRYEDRSSMAFSIESRVPFLTPALVNFCLSVPERYHIAPDGTGKALLRRAMRGIVPDEILARRDKIGFQTPERQWLAALRPWVAEAVHSNVARAIPALNPARVIREWEAVLAGRTRFDGRFWRIVNLIRWADALGVGFDG